MSDALPQAPSSRSAQAVAEQIKAWREDDEQGYYEMVPLLVEAEEALIAAADALAAQDAELQQAIQLAIAVINDEPLPNGQYPHALTCSGDRTKPIGTPGITCSCGIGRRIREAKQQTKDITRTLRETQDALEKAIVRYQAAEENVRMMTENARSLQLARIEQDAERIMTGPNAQNDEAERQSPGY